MELTFRQGIVRHQTNIAGTATFLRKSGSSDEYIDLVCDEDPLIFTIAHGNNNYLIEESKSVNQAWGPFAATGQTQYLYWDISLLNATLTRGYTLISPYFGTNEPAAPIAVDQHWFDSTSKTMKVWNGSKWLPKLRVFAATYDSNAILIPRPRGSQVNLVEATKAGNIVLGKNGSPLRDTDGTFVTSESDLISAFTSGENVKLEGMQLYGEALEFIPKFSLVTFDAPGKVKLASGLRPNEIVNGIMTTEYFPGEIGNIVSAGIVRNDQWSFTHVQANEPIFCGPNGEITLTAPNLPEHWYIGYVYDATSIVVNIQKRGATNSAGPASVGIELEGDVIAAGISSAPITAALSTTGVTAGTYNNVTVDVKGRVSNGSNAPYLIANELITVTGDVLGQGSTAIPLTLVNSGVTAGTYNEVTVDSKGRVIAGSTIPFSSINPLLTNFNDGSNTTISNWSTKVIQFDNSFVGSSTGLGTVSNPGDIVLGLRDSGVAAGTYNSVTVDLKGRVVAASNVSYSQTTDLSGDVIGSGIGSVITTLSLTGITPGIYNSVTVDAKGRVTSGTVESYATPVTLTGSVNGTGTGTINTTLSATGVVAGSYNNFIVGIDGRITSASNVSYDQNVVLSGDITGSGIGSISTTLSNTGVIPGTYNSLTVDSKGRITAATIEAPFTPSTTLNGDVTGNGIGTLTTSLSLTGVSAGTYNSVTVDAKGRVTSGTIENYQFPTTLTGDVTGTGTGTFATSLSNTGVIPGTYNSVTVDAKGRVTSASIAAVSGVQYLPDLLDVTVTSPATNQSLLWNGTEWNNATLDRIVSQYNNLTSQVKVDQTNSIITHDINDTTFITTTPTITAIGKSAPPEFWYSLFDAGTVLQTNVEFHVTCIDVFGGGDDIIVGGYAKNVNAGAAIQNKAFVATYNRLGYIIWQKGFQGAATQSSPTSTPTTIEALVVNQNDTTTYVGLTSDAESSIVKLDNFGNIVWQTKFDTYYGVISDMVIRANDSSLFVSGYQSSNGRGYIGKFNMTTGAVDYFYELQRFRTYALELSSSGNELFVGGDLFDSPLDDNFANIFKFNVTGNSFAFVSNVTANLFDGKRYVDLKRVNSSIYALGTQPASSGSMGDYSIIKYNEATLAVEASKQFYDAFFVRFVNGVGMTIDNNGNVYVLGYEGNTTPSSNNQLSLVKFNSSLVLEWQKTFGHPSFGDRHYNLNGIVANGNAVYITGSTFDTYASSGLVLKYPQDGSITGTFGTHIIANDSKFEGTPTHNIQSIIPSAITSLTPSTTTSVISLVQSNVSHLSFISIGGGVDYYIDLIGQLQINGSAGNAGQVLSSNGGSALPSWNTLAIPSILDNLSDVSINDTFPLMASDVLTYHLGTWKNSQLPIATNMTTGVVKIGSGLSVDGSGLLTATGGGATTLDGLTDAIVTAPTTGQLLQYNGTTWSNTNNSGITISQYSTDAAFATITSKKARGTSSAPTAIIAGDRIMGLYANGYHSGGAFAPNSGAIQIIANENFTSTAQGTYISFETVKNTTNVRLEQIRITDQGHLQFSQPSQKILGDFSHATHANRVAFQTSTVNGNTGIPIIPNGTATTAGIFATNTSNITNFSYIQVAANATDMRLISSKIGTGSFLPLTFYTSDIEQLRITTVGNLQLMGTSGQRILGDFSNATHANRVAFQTSTANSSTMIPIAPSGTATNAGIFAANSSSIANCSFVQLMADATYTRISAGALGTGALLPFSIFTNNTEQVRIPETVVAVNYMTLQGSGTGSPVIIGANGTDANITIKLAPKGTGEVQFLANNIAQNNGNFATYGDAITREYILRNSTTNATPTELFLNGSSTKMTLVNDSTWKFEIHVVARRTDVNDESAAYTISGCIDRNASAATTALVGTPTVTVIGEDTAVWDVTVDADTTNGGLRILVTGEAAKTIRWVAFVRTVEVIG